MKIWDNIKNNKDILILGFGREGQSTYNYIRKYDKNIILTIADVDEKIKSLEILSSDKNVVYKLGPDYLHGISNYDCIIKTPGISLSPNVIEQLGHNLTSQADLFLKEYKMQIIGITGTKGKSTTASFVDHYLKISGANSILLGNIGLPPFNFEDEITDDTVVVYELSSHMLQGVHTSPHLAIFLNLFPEHLDYYKEMKSYTESKAKIFQYQTKDDFVIFGDKNVLKSLSNINFSSNILELGNIADYVSDKNIISDVVLHNLLIGAKIAVLKGAKLEMLDEAIKTFKTLPHRLQNLGEYKGITFIDDSISTIPEASIVALEAFPNTNILILGGLDRGISYDNLIDYILEHKDLNVFCIDESGKKIFDKLVEKSKDERFKMLDGLESAVSLSYDLLKDGGLVVLSPAAASYNNFKNFEERGLAFLNYIMKYNI